MKDGWKHIDEILEEVAQEKGIKLKEIKEVWEHQKHFVKKSMQEPETYAIFIPYIGTLSLNLKQYKSEVKVKNKKFYKTFTEKVKQLVKHPNFTHYGNSHKKTDSVTKILKYINNNFIVNDSDNKWDILAKYSNGKLENKKNE